jgi:hypothetical protein
MSTPPGKIQVECQPTYPGWMYFLYCMHQIIPTSLFLVPLSFTTEQLQVNEKRDLEFLEEKHKALQQQQRLLEAMLPKSIAERLLSGEK